MVRIITLISVLFVCVPTLARTQSVDIVLMGHVSDQTGSALPGATVTATNEATGIVRGAVTDLHGRYSLFNLPPGTYTVRMALDGFAPRTHQAQTLHVGTTVTIDSMLGLAGVSEQVTVRGALTEFETTRNSLTRIVQRNEIDALPVINRNFNDLAALAPGVTKTGVYGGVDISGSRDFQNGYQLDGVSAERQHLGDQRVAYAQDWVQEFQVLTSQFNVEFGQAAGGVLNVITRSGSNQKMGRLYGFFRDDAWDATPMFAAQKPPLHERRIGGTLGGAVVKDRIFYFGGVEHFSNTSSNIVNSTFASANGTFPFSDTRMLSLAKIEIFANDGNTIRLRSNRQSQRTAGASVGGVGTEEHGRFSDTRAIDVVGAWTRVVSLTTLNEARAAWSTVVPVGGCNFATRNPPGTWFERVYPGAQFGCPVNFGTIAEDQFQFIDNLSWTHGAHDLKLGLQASWTRSSGDFRNFRDGRYSFDRDVPFSIDDPGSYPISFVMIEGPTTWDVTAPSIGVFVQDSWRTTDDVTMNFGVRYDVDGSLTALNPLVRLDKGLHTVRADLNNMAPRAGIAWTPFENDRRTLVRGGGGLYYDQNHNNVASLLLLNNVLVDRTVALSANNRLLNPFWPDIMRARSVLAESLERNAIPDVTQLGQTAGATNDIDENLGVPSSSQVSGGVAHEFRRWFNASADFVHTRGNDLYVIRNTNLDNGTFEPISSHYTAINSFGNGGTSRYRALQLQANVIPKADQFVKLAYTLARNRSNTAATLSAGAATNPFDYSEDEGPTDNDVRHVLTVNGTSVLPFGFHISGIVSYRSALPYSATTAAPRPDGKPFGFRPEPRNARRGDSSMSIDLRLAKVVTFGPRRTATALVELFNATNHVNYSSYIGTITSSRFGEPTTAGPARRIQLGFRVDL